MGLDDRDLVCRYQAGESLDTLAAAAGLTRNGLYARLRRLGQPPRRAGSVTVSDDEIRRALAEHGSINAAAKALGVTREALTGDAQFLGLVPDPPDRPDDLAATYEQLGSIEATAAHYGVAAVTVTKWLRSLRIRRQPAGRKPRT